MQNSCIFLKTLFEKQGSLFPPVVSSEREVPGAAEAVVGAVCWGCVLTQGSVAGRLPFCPPAPSRGNVFFPFEQLWDPLLSWENTRDLPTHCGLGLPAQGTAAQREV